LRIAVVLGLFLLELQRSGSTRTLAEPARAHLSRVMTAVHELEAVFIDNELLKRSGKELLRAGSDLVFWSQKMLHHWCDVLGQSPTGGIALMKLLRTKFREVPIAFYSRKATVADVKLALAAGALDVLIKPHRSLEDAEAVRVRDILARYCQGAGPEWHGHQE